MWLLAYRQLMSRKRQSFLILFGISLGTMMYVVIAGVQLGMKKAITAQLMNNTAHVRISAEERKIDPHETTLRFYGELGRVHWVVPPGGKRDAALLKHPQGWLERLRRDPNVVGFAPSLRLSAIASRGEIQTPLSIVGVNPERQMRVTAIADYMTEGEFIDIGRGAGRMIVGDGVLEKLGARVGDTIKLSIGSGAARAFKIVGAIHLGMVQLDSSAAYISLEDAQQFNRSPGRVSEIAVSLYDMDLADEIAHRWAIGASDKVESWSETNANFLQIFKIQDISRTVITLAILIVAGFGIYNVLSIMISQKKKEIAILRSIGFPPRKIVRLFLIQGVGLGMTGALVGLVLGTLACMALSNVDLGAGSPMMRKLLVSYDPTMYMTGFMVAVLSAVLASLLPALQAGRLTPLDIIRSEG